MPFLEMAQVQDLLDLARVHGECSECGHQTAMDYDRTMDEFYWIHQPGCPMYEDRGGHRLTIVPFVEDRSN